MLSADLLPPGLHVQQLGDRDLGVRLPGSTADIRATAFPTFFDEHIESVQLLVPGGRIFRQLFDDAVGEPPEATCLADLLHER
jgi:hypothetical protein